MWKSKNKHNKKDYLSPSNNQKIKSFLIHSTASAVSEGVLSFFWVHHLDDLTKTAQKIFNIKKNERETDKKLQEQESERT